MASKKEKELNVQDIQPAEDAVVDMPEEQPAETGATEPPVNEVEKRKAQLAEAQQAVEKAQEEIESGREQITKASKEITEARKAVAAQKKQVRQAERTEKKQKRQEAVQKSKRELQEELERRKQALKHTQAEMNAKMKQLLSGELREMKKSEKTRGAEIIAVFAKHNFYANGFTPFELRTTLEDLGPTYVKIGQIMSSRVDMLPERYCKELEKLRQNVKELEPEIARAVIEQETGKKIDEIYQEFRDKPLGSASIGQVHYAVLKDGTQVVTKVQRPLIADMMRKDFVLLKKLGKVINMIGDTDDDSEQMIDLVSVIDELEKVTNEELDFRVEAENTRFFKEHCIQDEEKITCPTVIDELTTERIFTMTFVDGYSIAKKDRLIEDGYDPEQIGSVIVDNYLHQVLDVGTFHADPHQGNLMVSHGKPVWIDFGMIGRITEADVNMLQSLILSLVDRDLDTMVNTIMSMGATSARTDRNKLLEDADVMFDKYMNVTNLAELDLSTLLEEVTDLADKHHISLPGKYTMLVRSIATIEGVIEQLCPELNLFQLITDKLMDRLKKNLDVKQELVSAGKDILGVGKKVAKMPELAYDALNGLVKGRTKVNIELTSYEEILSKLNETTKNIILAVFACVLFIGSCILSSTNIKPQTPDGQPLISAVGIVFSIVLAIYTIRQISKKKK
jgi:ubiquinone biosynthesis protein